MPKNISEEENVKAGKKKSRRLMVQEEEDLRYILNNPAGRRFIWRSLEKAGIFETSYSNDTNYTMYKEGRRASGLELLHLVLLINPDAYLLMIKENREAEND